MDKLKAAFDTVRAEDCLQKNTLLFLQREITLRTAPRKRVRFDLPAPLLACAAVLILCCAFAYGFYFRPDAYVSVDVNPSVELALNRFNRVVGFHAYNADGESVLSGLSLRHKEYEEAILLLLERIEQEGFIKDDGLIAVTLRTDRQEEEILGSIRAGVTDFIHNHHEAVRADVFPVSKDTREEALRQDVSPAKYLAIRKLMEADPTASMESCKNHSIDEIRQMTRTGNHHANSAENEDDHPGRGNGPHHNGGHGGH